MTARDVHSLDAVARVRRVRERDSLAGLQIALREVETSRSELASVESRLAGLAGEHASSPLEFVALRQTMLALGQAVATARTRLESAGSLAASAQSHWQHDRTRLRTIEMLQERRLDEARAEALRADAKVQDEVATQLWRRTRALGEAS